MSKIDNATGKRFAFKIANASASAVVIALLASIFDTLAVVSTENNNVDTVTTSQTAKANIVSAGYAVDCVLDDGTVMTDVTCTAMSTKRKIRQFREYIKMVGATVCKVTLQTDNDDNFAQEISLIDYTPLEGVKEDTLNVQEYYDTYQNSTTKIEIPGLALALGPTTLMMMTVAANSEVTVTLNFA